jgi:hypothetical protein
MGTMMTTEIPPVDAAEADVLGQISVPAGIRPSVPARVVVKVTDARTGRPVSDLRLTHSVFMHLIATRTDLATFTHAHPEPTGIAGELAVEMIFPTPGRYIVNTEFRRNGQMADIHDRQLVTIAGPAPARQPVSPGPRSITVDGVRVELHGRAQAGVTSDLTFSVTDARTGQAGPGGGGQDGDADCAAEFVERVDQRDRRPPSAGVASVSEAVNVVTKVAPIPSAAMLSPVTITAGWGKLAARAYPAAAMAKPPSWSGPWSGPTRSRTPPTPPATPATRSPGWSRRRSRSSTSSATSYWPRNASSRPSASAVSTTGSCAAYGPSPDKDSAPGPSAATCRSNGWSPLPTASCTPRPRTPPSADPTLTTQPGSSPQPCSRPSRRRWASEFPVVRD